MSGRIRYRQCGNSNSFDETQLEPFYDALLPYLKAYGITAQFPADKPSNEMYMYGVEFDVWIGEPPCAVRYRRFQASLKDGNGDDSKSIRADSLSHFETGDKLSFEIHIGTGIPIEYKLSGNWFETAVTGEKEQVEIIRNAIEPVIAAYKFNIVELEIKPLDEEFQASVSSSKTGQEVSADFPRQLHESPTGTDAPQVLPAERQTATVVPEKPTSSKGFNLLMGAALLLLGILVFIQFYSRLLYVIYSARRKIHYGKHSEGATVSRTKLNAREESNGRP